MAGRPRTRAKRAAEAAAQAIADMQAEAEPEAYPEHEGKNTRRGASAERMREITRLRMEQAKTDPAKKGGRPRTRFTKEEAEDHALRELYPRALKVLAEQLSSPDESIRQRAALKVIEYKEGKPTQRVEQETKVQVVRYESAPWAIARGYDLELEAGDVDDAS